MTDIERIAVQEETLQFEQFNADTAWELGNRLKKALEARKAAAAIDIQLHGQPLFFFAMPGTTPDNADWIRRKRNTTARFHQSSYALGLKLKEQNTTLTEKVGVEHRDYATHGGCFPIKLRGTGCIGTITVSGLPQREDHNVIVEVLAEWLGYSVDALRLD